MFTIASAMACQRDPRVRRSTLFELTARCGIRGDDKTPLQRRLDWIARAKGQRQAEWVVKMLVYAGYDPADKGSVEAIPLVVWLGGRSTERVERSLIETHADTLRDLNDYLKSVKVDDLAKLTAEAAFSWSEEWHAKAVVKAVGIKAGEVVLRYHDDLEGWTAQQLTTRKQLESEGHVMRHCVGTPGYVEMAEQGSVLIFSIRDPDGSPRLTFQLEPEQLGLVQARGFRNAMPGLRMSRAVEELRNELKVRKGLLAPSGIFLNLPPGVEIVSLIGDDMVLLVAAPDEIKPPSQKGEHWPQKKMGVESDARHELLHGMRYEAQAGKIAWQQPLYAVATIELIPLLAFQVAPGAPIKAISGCTHSWFNWLAWRPNLPLTNDETVSLLAAVSDTLRLSGLLPDVPAVGTYAAECPGFQLRAISGDEAIAVAPWVFPPVDSRVGYYGKPVPQGDSLLLLLTTSHGSPLFFLGLAEGDLSGWLNILARVDIEVKDLPDVFMYGYPLIEAYLGYSRWREYSGKFKGGRAYSSQLRPVIFAHGSLESWLTTSAINELARRHGLRADISIKATLPSPDDLWAAISKNQGKARSNLLGPREVALFLDTCEWALQVAFEHGVLERDVEVYLAGLSSYGKGKKYETVVAELRTGEVSVGRKLFVLPLSGDSAVLYPRIVVRLRVPVGSALAQDPRHSFYIEDAWKTGWWRVPEHVLRDPLPEDLGYVTLVDRYLPWRNDVQSVARQVELVQERGWGAVR
jgi:hypothetical protein